MFVAEHSHAAPAWWSRLRAGESLFSDPRWLDLFTRSRGEPPPWWFAAGRSGPQVGLRGTVVEDGARKSMNPYRWLFEPTPYHDREPFDAACAPPPPAWFPLLLCSYPGLEAYPVGDPGQVAALLAGVVDWAAGQGVRTVVVGFVQPARTAFAGAAAGFHPLPVATRADLPLAGRTAEQVFASWSVHPRRLRRRLDIEVTELRRPLEHLDDLVDLRCAHAGQHGKAADPAEERSWLEPLLTRLADRVTVFGALDGRRLRGFSLFVDDGLAWHAFAVARLAEDRDLYFELMFNTPVEQAVARGLGELSFGYGTGEAKRRRGCVFTEVPAWYSAADPEVAGWLAAHRSDQALLNDS